MATKTNGFACISRYELRSKECIDTVLKPLTDHIYLPINGSLTSKDIFHTTISMAVDKNSIHSITKRYQKIPCETSLRHHLKKLNLNELIKSNEKILMQQPIGSLKTDKEYEFAIDYTNDPYYGKIDNSNENYVIRGQSKKSTNSFYSYISLYIINKKERFTISVLPVEKGKSKVEYLCHFIDLIKRLKFGVKVLCLDREFYSIDVFEFLRNQNIPRIPLPWLNNLGNRDEKQVLPVGSELLKHLYFRPDYNIVIKTYSILMNKQLEQDPEAMNAFEELTKRYGLPSDDTERLVAEIAILVYFLIGLAIGYNDKN